jgi:hypothetical protein
VDCTEEELVELLSMATPPSTLEALEAWRAAFRQPAAGPSGRAGSGQGAAEQAASALRFPFLQLARMLRLHAVTAGNVPGYRAALDGGIRIRRGLPLQQLLAGRRKWCPGGRARLNLR